MKNYGVDKKSFGFVVDLFSPVTDMREPDIGSKALTIVSTVDVL
jgi:hypothetical protein